MKLNLIGVIALLLLAFLTACGAKTGEQATVASTVEQEESESPAGLQTAKGETAVAETAVDEQGAVSVAVTPLNLSREATTLDFEVTMNTHSVDLSMDLAALATLKTDNGRIITPTHWNATPGGHHVSGVLSFPAMVEGTAVLSGASQLTLVIRDVDAPERLFVWPLTN